MAKTTLPNAEELRISTRRDDGSLSQPVIIWFVEVNDQVFARSVYGETPWFRALRNRQGGRIQVGGRSFDVTFTVPGTDDPDAIDNAYRAKYQRYPSIVPDCVNDTARAGTFRIDVAD